MASITREVTAKKAPQAPAEHAQLRLGACRLSRRCLVLAAPPFAQTRALSVAARGNVFHIAVASCAAWLLVGTVAD